MATIQRPPPKPLHVLSPEAGGVQRFSLTTGEFVIAGILPDADADLSMSSPLRHLRDCALREASSGPRTWPKCTMRHERGRYVYITRGPSTDVRAWWPACTAYRPAEATR